jgi:low temperature requirement protein LtrA
MTDSDHVPTPKELAHHAERMGGRDPHEKHRTATPLELLFDLTFVIAFGLAASQLAHLLAEGHYGSALMGFGFACFAICWAWVNFSWFASAYDTDDWIFRVVTMVQMIGVLVLALGLPKLFHSIDEGHHIDNSIVIAGYVIMRLAMIFQWLRAARQDPARRSACITYAISISLAQIGWVVLAIFDLSVPVTFFYAFLLVLVEMTGPYIAERYKGGTPWHAHHIVERYGLLAIIALGEGVVGTVASISAIVDDSGWTVEAGMVCIAGVGLTFAMWWVYYILPGAHVLHKHRERSFVWGYGHIVLFAAIVATGAGLHVAAYYINHKAHIGSVATLLTVAIPLLVYLASLYALYTYMMQEADRLHLWLIGATLIVVAASIAAAWLGVNLTICLIILTLAPIVTVIGYEVLGHQHQARALEQVVKET